MTRARRIYCLALGLAALLGGCTDAETTVASTVAAISDFDPLKFFETNKVNMAEKNYAAADYLVDRGRGFIKPGAAIRATPLLDVQEPRLMTQFGRLVPEQIGERLTQLGYNVDLSAVSTDVRPEFQSAPQPAARKPDFILSGSYIRRGSDLDLRINITDADTGLERAMFNYTLPRTSDIRSKSKPQPTIYRLPNN